MPRQRNGAPISLADEELMDRVGRGDADAFEVIYERHSTAVYSLAMRLVGQPQAAQDLAQESFVAAWRSAAGYRPTKGSVRSWLLTIVRNRGIDRLRGREAEERRQVALEAGEATRQEPRLEDVAVTRATASAAIEGLADLPPDQSKAISLAFYGGYSHSEISELLGVPLGTVKTRVRRGLDSLRRSLETGRAVR